MNFELELFIPSWCAEFCDFLGEGLCTEKGWDEAMDMLIDLKEQSSYKNFFEPKG